ncbi:MAG: hypothetical protein QNK36_10590 [Colwellia sp.]|nr:hypothetical protein [Colwellia sp.]
MTDETTYQETLASIPSLNTGEGRVFIYIPKGGPDIMSTLGVIDFISIDKYIFRFGGESYFYLDIEAGSHHVTTTDVVKPGFTNNKRQYGKNSTEITVPEGEVIYLRIVAQKARAYKLELMPKSKAESEMGSLPLWTNSKTTMTIE